MRVWMWMRESNIALLNLECFTNEVHLDAHSRKTKFLSNLLCLVTQKQPGTQKKKSSTYKLPFGHDDLAMWGKISESLGSNIYFAHTMHVGILPKMCIILSDIYFEHCLALYPIKQKYINIDFS